MIKQLTLYGLFIIAASAQLLLMTRFTWVPDLMLVMVVFAGIFRGPIDGLVAGLIAGVIRGLFSVDTLLLDVILFPAVGLISAAISNLFYRHNAANQLLMVFVAMAGVVLVHTAYFNAAANNDISVVATLLKSWKAVLVTLIVSPFIFDHLRGFWLEED